eukprot:Plantae.Rhodophyta-Purpureofilum_apyrenoidigerum.ctg16527.p1 GENE.Plantae.Rhodophyta-Purpureofilum_apyrenoidigerum.ctg16527~~Plantae.Rhodophyta-Purpureofilum_apyrenoidigerum.ctg16527.p1  ORF type:complete len:531 (+),score=100.69 Plantae.Rhodophyta-Purpureofilum_apyrenoidigerum.ctg16527:142-1734(+)
MSVRLINPGAEVSRRGLALHTTISAAKGLQDVLRTNLGPKGTIKMLVSGAGDIKITKDGNVLLNEMQIQNPTASMIARTATAQDDMCGDGTTSTVLLIGELLKQAERYLIEGLHPRAITDGFDVAREALSRWIDEIKIEKPIDRELLVEIARCSLATKVTPEYTAMFAEIVTDAVLTVQQEGQQIDLHMVEIMAMEHRTLKESRLVKGLVLDHGGRHPDMPKKLNNAYILTCNVGLEYEKSEVQAGFFYSSADQREKLLGAERKAVDEKVNKIVAFKKNLCDGTDKGFVIINQKGIDPNSLDILARAGILALRRAKRRNMERLTRACGGTPVNSVDDLSEDVLGFAGLVYEQVLGDDKFTFVEEVENPYSCTVMLKGPNKHTIVQVKDALRDGLRAVKNTIEDKCVLPGAGAFEISACKHLHEVAKNVTGKAKIGVEAYGDALLVIPKTLAQNCGFDPQDTIIMLQEAHEKGKVFGLDLVSGEAMDPVATAVFDGYSVKKQLIGLSSIIATQLLLVDEILRAGRDVNKAQ